MLEHVYIGKRVRVRVTLTLRPEFVCFCFFYYYYLQLAGWDCSNPAHEMNLQSAYYNKTLLWMLIELKVLKEEVVSIILLGAELIH